MPQSLATHDLHSDTRVSKSTWGSLGKQPQTLGCHRTHSPCSLRHITSVVFTLPPYFLISQNNWNQHQAGILQREVPCLQSTTLAPGHPAAAPCPGCPCNELSKELTAAPAPAPAGKHTRALLSTADWGRHSSRQGYRDLYRIWQK